MPLRFRKCCPPDLILDSRTKRCEHRKQNGHSQEILTNVTEYRKGEKSFTMKELLLYEADFNCDQSLIHQFGLKLFYSPETLGSDHIVINHGDAA